KHRLGDLELNILSDGTFFIDAGATFGIVPRIMWEPFAGVLDNRYRLALGLNCLLVRSQGRLILIEAGVGDKPNGWRRQSTPASQGTLLDEFQAIGVRPEDVDIVLNTHLHADQCGWDTRFKNGELVPTFPNAEYIMVRDEWEAAERPNERTRATYLEENLAPLDQRGVLRLVDGETKITDEITLVPTPGHSAGHAAIVLESGGEKGVYIGDIAQKPVQLERTAWIASFDIMPLVSMKTKKALVEQAIQEQSLLISVHAPFPGLGRMMRTAEGQRRWVGVMADS
ncbi:MAG TPA: MBL fold metallo-hydrolase, partial [Dehalococcoidia bacterium]|nr:MBL fold metallo-hydrolase [Dehalococcoidia bacterium]